jgi:epidermal growth factor receptor substrate 15
LEKKIEQQTVDYTKYAFKEAKVNSPKTVVKQLTPKNETNTAKDPSELGFNTKQTEESQIVERANSQILNKFEVDKLSQDKELLDVSHKQASVNITQDKHYTGNSRYEEVDKTNEIVDQNHVIKRKELHEESNKYIEQQINKNHTKEHENIELYDNHEPSNHDVHSRVETEHQKTEKEVHNTETEYHEIEQKHHETDEVVQQKNERKNEKTESEHNVETGQKEEKNNNSNEYLENKEEDNNNNKEYLENKEEENNNNNEYLENKEEENNNNNKEYFEDKDYEDFQKVEESGNNYQSEPNEVLDNILNNEPQKNKSVNSRND